MAELFFAEFRFDTRSLRLEGPDGEIEIRAKTLELLTYLIDHRNRFVPRDELMEALWPGVTVTASSLTQCISELRQTLGDSANEPRFVETRIKKGYRFIATVYHQPTVRLEPLPPPPDILEDEPPGMHRRSLIVGALVVVCAMGVSIAWWALRATPAQPTSIIVVLVASEDPEPWVQAFGERIREAVLGSLSSTAKIVLTKDPTEIPAGRGFQIDINCRRREGEIEIGLILRECRSGEALWGWTWVVPREEKATDRTVAEIAARVRQAVLGRLN